VGRVIHTLPEGEPVFGVTSLDNHLFILRVKRLNQIEVYDIDSYRLQHYLSIPECRTVHDMVACGHNRCIYVADTSHILRVALPDGEVKKLVVKKWPVIDKSGQLSVTEITHNVLVTCRGVRKIKEFTTGGKLIREILLPQDVCLPSHTVQLSGRELIVCHGDRDDPLHRVCLIGSDGQVVKSYGGPPGAGSQQMNVPAHMAVDGNDCVFVSDLGNRRVLLLSPALTYIREVVSHKPLKWFPYRLSVDVQRRHLYVAENELKGGKFTAGRVIIVNV